MIAGILKNWLFGVELIKLDVFKRAVQSMQIDTDKDGMVSVGELYRVLKLIVNECR